jgi:short-chain fatty acids transporter
MAREVGLRGYEKKLPMHYPLLGAAGYAGLAVWHGGLSGSAPLLVATQGHFLADQIGVLPVTETLFSPLNLVVSVALILVLPGVFGLLSPSAPDEMTPINEVLPNTEQLIRARAHPSDATTEEVTFATRLENSVAISMAAGLAGMIVVASHFVGKGFDLNLDIVNFTFLFLGILLHRTPRNYVRAVSEGVKGCAGIILQFPFYSGIMGMMRFSGLVAVIAGWFVAISNEHTYPVLAYVSAGIINIFVPSGGGQWAVQGPVLVEAATTLDVSIPKCVMALAYGDQWTNLFQPFWALPLLGLTGLKARQIMGYCVAVMLLGCVPLAVALAFLPA